jgi:hypothetical protein
MKGLVWLLVALNVLVVLAGVSGTLQNLPFLPVAAPRIDANISEQSAGVRRLALLGEQAAGPPRAMRNSVVAQPPSAAPATGDSLPSAMSPRVSSARAASPQAQRRGSAQQDVATAAASQDIRPAQAPHASARTGADSTMRTCFEAGPFGPDGAVADEAARAGREVGGEVLGREMRGSGPVRHWVLIEGLTDRAAALREQERLRAAGYTDVMPVERPSGWAVSLGLFGQRSRAQAHRDALRAAGFDARVAQRHGGREHAWVRIALTDVQRAALLRRLPGGAKLEACREAPE